MEGPSTRPAAKFTDDGRLPDALHQVAEEPGGHEDDEQRNPEDQELTFSGRVQIHEVTPGWKVRDWFGWDLRALALDSAGSSAT